MRTLRNKRTEQSVKTLTEYINSLFELETNGGQLFYKRDGGRVRMVVKKNGVVVNAEPYIKVYRFTKSHFGPDKWWVGYYDVFGFWQTVGIHDEMGGAQSEAIKLNRELYNKP